METGVAVAIAFRDADPSAFAWREPPYEYEFTIPPIDILYGSDKLRKGMENLRKLYGEFGYKGAWNEARANEFVDRQARLAHPGLHAVTARLLCHNGDLPARLETGRADGDLALPGGGPVARVSILVKPTPLVHPPAGGAQLWRLVSQLSLNYASLADGGAETLRALLRLHNFADARAGEKHIAGIEQVTGTPVHARIDSGAGVAFARGHRVEVTFDEEMYAGGGVYLLAAVLERFLGLYVSMNSFCVLAARTRQRREPLREWAPRAGWKPLL